MQTVTHPEDLGLQTRTWSNREILRKRTRYTFRNWTYIYMGCFASKARGRGDSYSASNTPTRRVSTSHGSSKSNGGRGGPLSEKEIQMRIEAPAESQVFTVGGITFRYAWVSQRGYYPDCKMILRCLSFIFTF